MGARLEQGQSPRRGLVDRIMRRRWSPGEVSARDKNLTPWLVVTGGSRGIGFELARQFADRAGGILLVARDAATVSDAARMLAKEVTAARAYNAPIIPVEWYAMDVSLANAARRIETRVAEAGGYVDLLINSAGVGLSGSFIAQAEEQIDVMVMLNVVALTRLTRHFLPDMVARGRGGVVIVSSLAGYAPGPNQAAYYASKAYAQSLSEALSEEVAGTGVRIVAVAPGPVDTEFHKRMGAEGSPYLLIPGKVSPERVARSARLAYTLGLRSIVPGWIAKVGAVTLRLTPHTLSVPIMARLLRPNRKPPA